jgi:hypothetical protein
MEHVFELTTNEIKELKKLYSHFMSIKMYDGVFRQYNTSEEMISDKKELIREYELEFPNLVEKGISIYDLPDYIYSKNQLEFINDAEECGFEVDYSYSGRGMFGNICPCIRCDNRNDIKTKSNVNTDSMGLGVVIYAQY